MTKPGIGMKIAVVALLPLVAACTNRVLFVTSSQIGIDADLATQSANFGYDRYNGVIAPVFDKGAVPAVYARVATDGGYFVPKIRQVFATGEAAEISTTDARVQIMSRCKSKSTDAYMTASEAEGIQNWTTEVGDCDNATPLTSQDEESRRRMFFGTGTNLGLGLKFTPAGPGAINLGFKRRELSVIPLSKKYGTAGDPNSWTGERKYAPTIAAINMRIQGDCKSGATFEESRVCLSQFFATGDAALGVALGTQIRSFFGDDTPDALTGEAK